VNDRECVEFASPVLALFMVTSHCNGIKRQLSFRHCASYSFNYPPRYPGAGSAPAPWSYFRGPLLCSARMELLDLDGFKCAPLEMTPKTAT